MSTSMFAIFGGLAVIFLCGLMAYAWHLQRRLKALEEQQEKESKDKADRRHKQIHDATRGVRLLAGAMIQKDLTLTEGCMRIAYLLRQIDEAAQDKKEYSVFFQLASATAHIPVLEAWQDLSKQQKSAYSKERQHIEQAFEEFVLEATQDLLAAPLLNEDPASQGELAYKVGL